MLKLIKIVRHIRNFSFTALCFWLISPPALAAVNIQTTAYTIQSSDCSGSVQMGTGTSGLFALTFPSSVSGFPSSCPVYVFDGDTTRWKNVVGLTNFSWLYPSPSPGLQVALVNGSWRVESGSPRYRPVSSPTFYIDQTNGNDGNDCQTTGTGACETIMGAFNLACATIDSGGQAPLFQGAASETFTSFFNLQSGGLGASEGFINQPYCVGFDQATLDLAGSTLHPSGTNAIFIRGVPFWLAIQNMTLEVTGTGNDIEVYGGGATVEIAGSGVTIGAVGSTYAQISATRNGRVVTRVGANPNFSGGGGFALQAILGGGIEIEGGTATMSGTPAYTVAFAQAVDNGYVTFAGETFTGLATGPQWQTQRGGVIDTTAQSGSYTAVPGNNYLPGDTPGYYGAGGGIMDNPGTPTSSGSTCQASGPSKIAGTDKSGYVVLTSAAATSCRLYFTTLTAYDCVASANSTGWLPAIAAAQPSGQTQGSTPGYMQLSFPSNSGGTFYWHCDPPIP